MSYTERQALLEKIRDIGANKETANELKPDDLLAGIVEANEALIVFAKSEQKTADIEKVNAVLKQFNQ